MDEKLIAEVDAAAHRYAVRPMRPHPGEIEISRYEIFDARLPITTAPALVSNLSSDAARAECRRMNAVAAIVVVTEAHKARALAALRDGAAEPEAKLGGPFKELSALTLKAIIAAAEGRVDHQRAAHKRLGLGSIVRLSDIMRADAQGAYDSTHHRALPELVRSLSAEALAELTALMWLGRGDHDGEDPHEKNYADFLVDARHAVKIDPNHVEYVTDKSPLGEYLRDGLTKLGVSLALPPRPAAPDGGAAA